MLGDRIGIVARGLLRALGGSIRLKQKYGTGYQVMVALTQHHHHQQQQGLRQRRRSATTLQQQQQQGAPELSPRGVLLVGPAGAAGVAERPPEAGTPGRSPLGIVVPPTGAEDATASSRGSGQRRSQEEQQQVAAGPPGSPRSAAAAAVSATKGAVKALFAAHLGGLGPSEENRRSLQYLVPRQQQQQLVGLLEELEAAMAAGGSNSGSSGVLPRVTGLSEEGVRLLQGGVADVQLSLTTLEEVFLSIAKQVGGASGPQSS